MRTGSADFTAGIRRGTSCLPVESGRPSPTFAAPAATPGAQTLRFPLMVSDGGFSSAADTVDIMGTRHFQLRAVRKRRSRLRRYSAGGAVTLAGSGSSDSTARRSPISGRRPGARRHAVEPQRMRPTFVVPATAPEVSALTFQLIVPTASRLRLPDSGGR